MKAMQLPKAARALATVALAVLLLALFFRGSEWSEIQTALLSAQPSLLLWSLVTIMATYLIRALRWQILLSPLGRAGLWNCFSATVIGFMVNFLLFGRLGEIARPYVLARREGFSASGAFATILLERMLDLVTVVLFVGFALLLGAGRSETGGGVGALELGGLLGLAAALLGLGSMFLFARYPDAALRFTKRLLSFVPRRFGDRALGFVDTFRSGLGVLVDGSGLLKIGLMSVLLWLSICLSFWLGARAFEVEFGFVDTFLVIGFLTVGVAVPTPGAIGGYHVMCALALTTLFGTEATLAKAVALVSHAISFLPVTILGIFLFAKSGLSFRPRFE
jgi:uncharacterized protein (TIRG00374 family)